MESEKTRRGESFMTRERNVDWRAISLGTVAAAALAIVLIALSVGAALLRGAPPPVMALGLWAAIVGLASAAVGGYLAGRLRKRASSVTTHEIEIHDRAHGLGVWALGVVTASIFLATVAGGRGGLMIPNSGTRVDYLVDSLYRPLPAVAGEAPGASSTGSAMAAAGTSQAGMQAAAAERAEVGRILRFGTARGQLGADERAYVARLVAIATDRTQGEAERVIDRVMTEARQRTDTGRRARALLIVVLGVAAIAAAGTAVWGAILGGRHRVQS